jgi:hypothetical protein
MPKRAPSRRATARVSSKSLAFLPTKPAYWERVYDSRTRSQLTLSVRADDNIGSWPFLASPEKS